jgi:hypothetical protein
MKRGTAPVIPSPGADTSRPGSRLLKKLGWSAMLVEPTVSTWGITPGRVGGLPWSLAFPADATGSELVPKATVIAS